MNAIELLRREQERTLLNCAAELLFSAMTHVESVENTDTLRKDLRGCWTAIVNRLATATADELTDE